MNNRFFWIFLLAVLAAAGFAVYGTILNAPFQFDDYDYIVNYRLITSPPPLWQLISHPCRKILTYFTLMLNYKISKFDTFSYHLVNVLLHIMASFLVFKVISAIFRAPLVRTKPYAKYKNTAALFCSLIFLAHPIQTEAVTYIWQRSEVLAGVFYLSAFHLYLLGRLESKRRYFAFSFALFVVGFFAKETILAFPISVLLCELCFFDLNIRAFLNKKKAVVIAAMSAAVIAAGFTAYNMIRAWISIDRNFLERISPENIRIYLLTEGRAFVLYLRLMFFPVNQNLDYYFPPSRSFFEPVTFLSFAAIAAFLSFAAVLYRRGQRLLSFGMFWFFICLLPSSSLVPSTTFVFEHRAYLSVMGFAVFLTVLIIRNLKKEIMINVVLGIIVVMFALTAFLRNQVWRSQVLLMEDTVAKSPLNARPHLVLGGIYLNMGEYDKAFQNLVTASKLAPEYPDPHNNIGIIYKKFGNNKMAESEFLRAIELDDKFVDPYINLAVLYMDQKDLKAAREYLDKAWLLKNDRYRDRLTVNNANYYILSGDIKTAILLLEDAININPDNHTAYYNLANLNYMEKDYVKAVGNYKKALNLMPDFIDAYVNMGLCYYKMEDYGNSIRAYSEAVKLRPNDAVIYRNLANVYRADGNIPEAEKAVAVAAEIENKKNQAN